MSVRTLETPIATTAAVPARQVAVIDIGTASVRMAVAEINATGQIRQLETLAQAVNLGKDEYLVYSHTYRLGSLRLRETLEALRAPTLKVRNIMETHIHRTVAEMAEHVTRDGVIEMIALGGDVRFAVRQLQPEWDGRSLARLPLKGVEDFTNKVLGQSEDRIVRKYRLSYPEAETLGPALLAYVLLAKELQLTSVLVSNVNLRDGLLSEMAESDAWSKEFSKQIVRSAVDLGRKFE